MAQFSTSRSSPRKPSLGVLPSARFGTVLEARLSLYGTAAQRPRDASLAWITWDRRFRDQREWPLPRLEERLRRLTEDLLALAELVKEPPPDWDGSRWMEMYRRQLRWEGQVCALEQALMRLRSSDLSPNTPPSSGTAAVTHAQPATSSAAGYGTEDPFDPFEGE